jgi:hypothetical protein
MKNLNMLKAILEGCDVLNLYCEELIDFNKYVKLSGKSFQDVKQLWDKAKILTIRSGMSIMDTEYWPNTIRVFEKLLGMPSTSLSKKKTPINFDVPLSQIFQKAS